MIMSGKRWLFCTLTVLLLLVTACAEPAPAGNVPQTTTAPATSVPPRTSAASTPTAPPTSTAASSRYGGTLRQIKRYTPSGMYPPTRVSTGTEPGLESLLGTDNDGNYVPSLATEWKFSPDNKALTLTLRKGVKFHDGTDFNAAAVKFNLEQRKAGKFGDLDNVKSIDVVDDLTVRLNLDYYANILLDNFTYYINGQVSPTAVQTLGKDKMLFNPVGTGPFKFVSYAPNVSLKWTRFDGYWQKGKPYLDGISVTYIADPTTSEQAFQRGEADVASEVDAKNIDNLRRAGFTAYVNIAAPYFLAPDSANESSPFAKQAVREAVQYAIDGDAIAKAVGYGFWAGLNQIAPPNSREFIKNFSGRTFNPDKAKQLLASAGYGTGFDTSISYRNSMNREAMVAVQGYLKDVGINVTLKPLPTPNFASITTGGWNNGMILEPLMAASTPSWLPKIRSMLSAESVTAKSTQRPSGWQELLDKATQATDDKSRLDLSHQLIQMASDTAFVMPWAVYGRGVLALDTVQDFDWLFEGSFPATTPADTWLSK